LHSMSPIFVAGYVSLQRQTRKRNNSTLLAVQIKMLIFNENL